MLPRIEKLITTMLPRRICTWVVTLVGLSTPLVAGTPVYVGTDIATNGRVSMEQISHQAWDQLLRKYVDERGMVDYKAWHASRADQQQLDVYLRLLSSARIEGAPRETQLAFWINAYNAVTVKGILREYPTSSIRNHTARLVGYNIWKDLKLRIDDQLISLDEMEHQLLRKMGEPRIHFAIVCASIGCPRLLNEAFVADRLDEQLSLNTRDFFADAGKFQYDASRKQVKLSPILQWFGEDFGSNQTEQLRFVARYAPTAARSVLLNREVRVGYLDYDWNLNAQN